MVLYPEYFSDYSVSLLTTVAGKETLHRLQSEIEQNHVPEICFTALSDNAHGYSDKRLRYLAVNPKPLAFRRRQPHSFPQTLF